jgi:hypothetical protein
MSEARKTHIKTFLLWFPIVSISIYIGALLSSPIGEFVYDLRDVAPSASDDGSFEAILSEILLVGLFAGFGQWVVINSKIRNSQLWIPATILGFLIGSFNSFFLFAFVSSALLSDKFYRPNEWITVIGTLMGAGSLTGMFQWASLKKNLRNSFNWSLVTGLSLTLGFMANIYVARYPTENQMGWLVFSIVFGLISGIFAEPLIIRPNIESVQQQRFAS